MEISATKKWVSGHNLKRRPADAIVKKGRLYKEIKCHECGKDFLRRSDFINRRSLKNFCSSKCSNVNQARVRTGRILPEARKGEYRKCIICQKEYYLNPYRVKNGNSKFCGRECFFENQRRKGTVPKGLISSADNRGKKNAMYKHGKRTGKNATGKEKLRKQVIERDGGNWCLLCGKPGPGLHLHRIIYGSQGGKYELDNCVQLCPIDHEKVHSNKKEWMPYLLERVKENEKRKQEM